MKNMTRLALAALLAGAAPVLAHAHFILVEPAATLAQNRLGDPQKLGPCGGTSANAGTPTGAVTKVQGGAPLHVKIEETVYHPGHYRIALAVNGEAGLPAIPEVVTRDTPRGPWSVSASIQDPVRPPLLADGLFAHTARPAGPFETDVLLPNINCPTCTLQVMQFMAEHGYNRDGGYFYHHCAHLQIVADPSKPLDTRW
jgi:hypothetical protein